MTGDKHPRQQTPQMPRRCFRVNCHKMKTARSTTVFMYFVMSATSCCTSLSISNYQFSCNTGDERLFRHLEETCPTPGPTLVSMWIVNHWIVNQTTTVSVLLSITNLKSNGIGYMIILCDLVTSSIHMSSYPYRGPICDSDFVTSSIHMASYP